MSTTRMTTARVLGGSRWGWSPADPMQRTPDALFQQLDAEFHFNLDAASSDLNAKCDDHFTVADDALGKDWGDNRVWLNPPYGKGLAHWVRKAWEASRGGALVVVIIPCATEMGWWHDYALLADEIRFIRGRVQFYRESGKATIRGALRPNAILVFRPHLDDGSRLTLDI